MDGAYCLNELRWISHVAFQTSFQYAIQHGQSIHRLCRASEKKSVSCDDEEDGYLENGRPGTNVTPNLSHERANISHFLHGMAYLHQQGTLYPCLK